MFTETQMINADFSGLELGNFILKRGRLLIFKQTVRIVSDPKAEAHNKMLK